MGFTCQSNETVDANPWPLALAFMCVDLKPMASWPTNDFVLSVSLYFHLSVFSLTSVTTHESRRYNSMSDPFLQWP